MSINGVDHINIRTSDLDRCMAFYCRSWAQEGLSAALRQPRRLALSGDAPLVHISSPIRKPAKLPNERYRPHCLFSQGVSIRLFNNWSRQGLATRPSRCPTIRPARSLSGSRRHLGRAQFPRRNLSDSCGRLNLSLAKYGIVLVVSDLRRADFRLVQGDDCADTSRERANMAGSSMELHERHEDLSPETIDRHRATVSLLEELEAVDWYDQRAEAASDDELQRHSAPQPGRGDGARGHGSGVAAATQPGDRRELEPTCSPAGRSWRRGGRPGRRRGSGRGRSQGRLARHRKSAGGELNHEPSAARSCAGPDEAWAAIDEEATARPSRRSWPPESWSTSPARSAGRPIAVDLGMTRKLRSGPAAGSQARQRQAQPLVEFRVPFEVPRDKIEAVARGATSRSVRRGGRRRAQDGPAEDKAIFHGYRRRGHHRHHVGLGPQGADLERRLREISGRRWQEAMTMLRDDGIGGPYAIALGPRCYKGLMTTTYGGGYPVMRARPANCSTGPLVWAPGDRRCLCHEHARRRLRADRRPGLLGRLPVSASDARSGSISRRASRSATWSPARRLRCATAAPRADRSRPR